jgi:putative phosphoribosyl transferase
VELAADLTLPAAAKGVVAFAHGSGSGRHSPRNQQVAAYLNGRLLATLLLDLLTAGEEAQDARTREHRFDVPLLGQRLVAAVDWLAGQSATAHLPYGCFGASTGAAAALIAAAERADRVRAVVSRGGRPDLAYEVLGRVRSPTLLIVGERDPMVLELNQYARDQLGQPAELQIVAGATHLFEEPGALEQVSELAGDWFLRHLG